MSTLKLENIKHENSSTNNMVMNSNGSVSVTNAVTASGATALTVDRTTNEGDIIDVQKDGTSVGSIGVSGGNNMYLSGQANNHAGVTFATQSILPTTQGTVNNNIVDLGQNGNAYKDLYLGGGAYLGGTGAANKLDDYEEGTWTPTITGGGSFSIANATYTKIGKLVYAGFYASNTTGITSSGQALISLPFAVSGSNNYHGSGVVSYVGPANWEQYKVSGITPYSGNALMYFHKLSGTATAVQNSELQVINNNPFICGIVYQTDA